MGTGHPQEVFQGLVISEQISAVGCTPVAPFHQLMRASPSPAPQCRAPRGGQGRSAEGCGNMVPARRACDLPGSRGAPGTLPCLCSSFSFFSTFRFFFSLCFQLRMQHSPRFPPTVPVLIFFPLYKYVFLRLLLLPAQLPPSVLPSQTSFFFPSPCFPTGPLHSFPFLLLPFPPASRAPVHSLRLPFSDSLGEICLCQHTNSIIYWLSGAGSYTRL